MKGCRKQSKTMNWQNINTASFDSADSILIKTKIGIVEAWFHSDAQEWVCYDDAFAVQHTDDILWMPIPQ